MAATEPSGIFISYRRQDTAPYARSLERQLRDRFPHTEVFLDLDSIEAGLDFADVINRALGSCSVLLAIIGPRWATLVDDDGRPRIEDPNDYVRFEIQTALDRGIRVIPVLVDGAAAPRQSQLPPDLHKLARLNALELSYTRYVTDADRLIGIVQRVLDPASGATTAAPEGGSPDEAVAGRPAGLGLSERMIDLGDIDADDRLHPERIYVWGRGGGPVDWWVETRATWLSVSRGTNYFEISFAPQPGRNHATVEVHDRASGEVHIVRVQVRRRQPSADQAAAPPVARDADQPPADATQVAGYVTPLVTKLAVDLGVDLSTITGTGVGGRIRREDVLDAARAGVATPITMPRLGESATEGTVTRWLKSVGDTVEADEPVVEVSTDKVDTDIPSPVSGILTRIVVSEDETVEVGAALGYLRSIRKMGR